MYPSEIQPRRVLLQITQRRSTQTLTSAFSLTAPPFSEVTTTPPTKTTTAATTTTVHWGVDNNTTTTGYKERSRGAPRPRPVIPQTPSPPPLESFPLPERFCKAIEKRDIMWPQTQRGMLVERPCPKGTRGKQRRLCFSLSQVMADCSLRSI